MADQQDRLRAAQWMIGAIICFSLLAIAGRQLKGALDTFEIMLYRSVLGVVLTLGAALYTRRMAELWPRRMGLQFSRSLFHFAGQNLWFYAVTVAPLTQVFALEFTMPLWALLLAVPLLGEALTGFRLRIAVAGFLGVLIVTRPWVAGLGPGLIEAALSAIGFGVSAILTRKLTRDIAVLPILFWLSVIQLGLALVGAGYDGVIATPNGMAILWAVAIGAGGLLAHLSLTSALARAPASFVLPLDFARLPLIAVAAFLIYGEGFDIFVFIGALVIFAANYVNILLGARKS